MAFKKLADLNTGTTVALGGLNKKTGKPNPTKLEGYYLGTKQVVSPKSRTGFSAVHVFQTPKGETGVWGKTDLDSKMKAATLGAMTRITQSGKQAIPGKNDMYKFTVEVDEDNTIEVSGAQTEQVEEETSDEEYVADSFEEEESAVDADDEPLDEIAPVRATPQRQAANTVDAARQARVQALLSGKGKSKTV